MGDWGRMISVVGCSCTETLRISLFKSYCSSLYTSSLWCNYRSESLRKLCVAYNNVFRKMTFLPRDHRRTGRGGGQGGQLPPPNSGSLST